MHAAPIDRIEDAAPPALHAAALFCFFCESEEERCDCGKYDPIPEDVPLTFEQQCRIEDVKRRQDANRKEMERKCVQKSWKGMACNQIKYTGGEYCRVCPLRKQNKLLVEPCQD